MDVDEYEEQDVVDSEPSWFDSHPLASDLIILFLPGVSVFAIWLLFGVSLSIAATQGGLITLAFIIGLAYLERKHETSVFRYITLRL